MFPTTRIFRRAFLRFRKRYPDVRDFIVWNEANHPLSLSSDRPGRVAKLFDVAARNCARCRVIGADVLDISGMTAWVRAFMRRAEERPRIWGLHNYVDVKNRGSTGTLALAGGHARQGLVHRDRRMDRAAQVRRWRDRAGVPVYAAQGSARDAARSAPDMPEPSHPARVPLQLAGAEARDDLGLRSHRPLRSAASGL